MRGKKHNPEGYLDLTAYKALYGTPKAGEVWKYERRDGRVVEELIVRNYGEVSSGLLIVDDCTDNCITVKSRPGNDTFRYVNPQMIHYIFNKKLRYFVKRLSDEDFARVIKTLKKTLNLDGGAEHG